MTRRRWDDDDRLFEDLAEAVRATRPLAEAIAAQAEGVLSWRTIDEDLLQASLTFDSSLDALAGTRAEPGQTRLLVFTSTPLSMELEVNQDEVVGQILPPGPGEIHVENPDGTEYTVSADESGFFQLPLLPADAVRLRCDTPTGRVVTDWVRL
ncbi:hypothetical protein [Kribbella sindirgiensis]|uniref:Uncharacterized protein n=1 Tax=Kribbella sindirgiensis TaxID=1124744 RepID=A0A4R0ITI0_9ACTN|nr:hypothetical protein [Kribbella sindirgiensis]TCC34728.1 hypothetical protein E0H50_12490 [Kribbella sindirgiensis]